MPDIDPIPLESDTASGKLVLAVNVAPSPRLVGVKAEVSQIDGWNSNDSRSDVR